MKRPETQAEFDAYIATETGAAYLASDELEARCADLERRFNDGETMTVEAAAELVGLPVNIFRHLYAMTVAGAFVMQKTQAEASTATKH
jgi:hypothetical protein